MLKYKQMSEHQLYEVIAEYLQLHHSGVIYRFDLASDLKLTIGQAKKHKKLHPTRGYPDLFIAEPNGKYAGLFLEIKKDGTSVFKKDGTLRKDAHLEEQFKMLQNLVMKGYKANFAIGYDDCIKQIEEYLNGY